MNKVLLILSVLLFQIFVLNEFLFLQYINPYLYIIIILLFPIHLNQVLLLLYSFIIGLIIDIGSITFQVRSVSEFQFEPLINFQIQYPALEILQWSWLGVQTPNQIIWTIYWVGYWIGIWRESGTDLSVAFIIQST